MKKDASSPQFGIEKSVISQDAEIAFNVALEKNDVMADSPKRLEIALDLNGDEVLDYVISVKSESDKEPKLLMILLSGNRRPHVLSRDATIQYPTPHKLQVINPRGSGTYTSQPVFGDGLLITKTESSSAFLYWNGDDLVSTWVGE